MTRKLRSVHRVLWLLLAVTVGCVFVVALALRPLAHAAVAAPISAVQP